jgi:hypothetical protein
MTKLKNGGLLMMGASALSMLLTGCETPEQSALAGAATGAVMGGLLKGGGHNVARGAAIGAAGGYVLGKYGESERRRGNLEAQGGYSSEPVYSAPPPEREVYYSATAPRAHYYHENLPYGRPSRTYGYVFSPFTGQLVDVRGIPRGAKVVDPSSGRSFLNP